MRIVTRKKLYRAFPELDSFTDRECKLFVQRVKKATGRMVVLRVTTAFVTLIAFPLVAISTTLPPERRILPEAKTRFVAPDLAPLPRIVGGGTN